MDNANARLTSRPFLEKQMQTIKESNAPNYKCPYRGIESPHCHGAGCMAWAWETRRAPPTPEQIEKHELGSFETSETKGYCGIND